MKKLDPNDLKPCAHMQELVSAHVDGQLTGVKEWYTVSHIKGCKQCQASIPFLESLKDRLHVLDVGAHVGLQDSERLAALEQELVKIEGSQNVQ